MKCVTNNGQYFEEKVFYSSIKKYVCKHKQKNGSFLVAISGIHHLNRWKKFQLCAHDQKQNYSHEISRMKLDFQFFYNQSPILGREIHSSYQQSTTCEIEQVIEQPRS